MLLFTVDYIDIKTGLYSHSGMKTLFIFHLELYRSKVVSHLWHVREGVMEEPEWATPVILETISRTFEAINQDYIDGR